MTDRQSAPQDAVVRDGGRPSDPPLTQSNMLSSTEPRQNARFLWRDCLPELRRRKILLSSLSEMHEVPTHGHEFLELTYITSGRVLHTLDGQEQVLGVGDYFIVDYGSRHSYCAVGGEGYGNIDCLFLPELLDPALRGTVSLRIVLDHYLLHYNIRALTQNPAHMVFHDGDGRILELLERMRCESERCEPGYTELLRCYLIEVLLLTMRRLDDASSAAAGNDVCGFLAAYVRDHYMEQISLQELAKRLNYSVSYVSRIFKNGMGVSFMTYLQNYRVAQGCRLLASSDRTVEEVASMVGYRDAKFFSSLIRRFKGRSGALGDGERDEHGKH